MLLCAFRKFIFSERTKTAKGICNLKMHVPRRERGNEQEACRTEKPLKRRIQKFNNYLILILIIYMLHFKI